MSYSSKTNGEFYNVPLGGKIPDLTHFHTHEETKSWSNELTVSALYYTGELTHTMYLCIHTERRTDNLSHSRSGN